MHAQRRGYHLWRLFNNVIELTQNVRQQSDEEYQEIVRAARAGRLSDKCLDRLNTRAVSAGMDNKVLTRKPAIVAYTNVTRKQMSMTLMEAVPRRRPRRLVRLFAVARPLRRPLSVQKQSALMDKPSQGTADMEMILDVYCGLPVFVTKNLATELGIANGTRATVTSVQFEAGTFFRELVVEGGGIVMVPSNPAEVVWITVESVAASHDRLPCIPLNAGQGAFPVMMSKFRGGVQLPGAARGNNVVKQVAQFPLTPAFFMTPYKLQGPTVSALCISAWRTSRSPSCTTYLILSRPQMLSQLMVVQPVFMAAVRKYGPGRALLAEDRRLNALSIQTVLVWKPRLAAATARGLLCGMHTASGADLSVGKNGDRDHPRHNPEGRAGQAGVHHACDSDHMGALQRGACDVESARKTDLAKDPCSSSLSRVGVSLAVPSVESVPVKLRCVQPVRLKQRVPGHLMSELAISGLLPSVDAASALQVPVRDEWSGATSDGELQAIKSAMALGDPSVGEWDEVARPPGIGPVARYDLRAFRPGGCLASDGMYVIMLMLQSRHDRRVAAGTAAASCLFLAPYFYPMIEGSIYNSDHGCILSYHRGRNVFSQRAVFVPIHEGADHWFLAVVLPREGIIMQFNSLGSHSENVFVRRSLWLNREAQRSGLVLWTKRTSVCYDGRSPQQDNGDDCGFFVVHSARVLADGQPVAFDASVMPRIRTRFAADVLRGCID